jgi:ABC-type multidrug transport system fused ATPase/permease subunit
MSVFDSIVLLEDGKITAQSTHEKLISINPWYANGVKCEIGKVPNV